MKQLCLPPDLQLHWVCDDMTSRSAGLLLDQRGGNSMFYTQLQRNAG